MARKRRFGLGLIGLIIVLAIAGYYLLHLSGYLAKGSSIALDASAASEGCAGRLVIKAEMTDSAGIRVPDALISIYVGNEHMDSLYTDRNGMVRLEGDIRQEWCGRDLGIMADFAGSGDHLESSAMETITIKSPSALSLNASSIATVSEPVLVEATLKDGLSGAPLRNRTIMVGASANLTDADGKAMFSLVFSSPGDKSIDAAFSGDRYSEGSEDSAAIEIKQRTCSDGTPAGRCSGQLLCAENLSLAYSCGICGCPAGLLCIGGSCISPEQKEQRIIEALQMSSVLIESDSTGGSGVIIASGDGKSSILTNRHVIDPDMDFDIVENIEIFNMGREIGKPSRILYAPRQIDLALIVVDKEMGPAAAIGSNASIARGASVFALGSPLGIQNTVTKGIVSNFYETGTDANHTFDAIQVDAAVNPGNSGGGIFLASDGTLIGITTFKLLITRVEAAEGLGFAIPVSLLEEFPADTWPEVPAD